MNQIVRYLSHPQVLIEPEKDIQKWSLNRIGQSRVAALANSNALQGTTQVFSSAETKALETAHLLALPLGCDVETRCRMHENDRSSTGFLPPLEFEDVADQFFANPNQSVRGWETAICAQTRILQEVDKCLQSGKSGDILIVGHGAVGTLLYCALANLPISRKYDQGSGGGGCYFAFDQDVRIPMSAWQPMENLY